MKPVLVVGAGLSGLATAWALVSSGHDVTIVEASAGAGGLIGTTRAPHGLVERAANAFVWTDTTRRWFETLGIEPRFPLETAKRRYIFTRGRPRRWPLSAGESAVLAARVARAAVTRGLKPRSGETIAAFGDRIGGRGLTRHLLGPALQGIYGAAPDQLSAEAVFGGRRRRRGGMAAPAGGMGEFIDRLRDALIARGATVRFGARVDEIDPATPTAVCTNVSEAARLLRRHAPALAAALAATPVASLLTVTAFFAPHPRDLPGFGVLYPRAGDIMALGSLFNTSIFDGRGDARSETWIYGGDGDGRGLPADAAVRARVIDDRARLTGRRDEPIDLVFTRHVPALPVYGASILDVRRQQDDLPPWLAVSGNYLGGIGVAALLEQAEAAAARIGRSA